MKSKILAVVALAAASLCMAACAGFSAPQIDSALSNAQIIFQAAKTTVDTDAQAGVITASMANQIDGYITAGDQALAAAQQAFLAGDATTEQAKVQAVLTAAADINGALLTAVATYSAAHAH